MTFGGDELIGSLEAAEDPIEAKLKAKIPEIEATYGALRQMRAQAETGSALTAHYELAQSIFGPLYLGVFVASILSGAAFFAVVLPLMYIIICVVYLADKNDDLEEFDVNDVKTKIIHQNLDTSSYL